MSIISVHVERTAWYASVIAGAEWANTLNARGTDGRGILRFRAVS